MKTYTFRFLHAKDAQDVLDIYSPFITDSVATFEETVPSLVDFQARILKIAETNPFIVAEYQGKVVGYAYGSAHRSRGAYKWSKEVSVYLLPSARGEGLAKHLYVKLFEILRYQGVKSVLAGISHPNDVSFSFHLKMGFVHIGRYPQIGYKEGNWVDVSWYSLILDETDAAPMDQLRDYRLVEWF